MQMPCITDEPLWDRITVLSTTSPLDLRFFVDPQGCAAIRFSCLPSLSRDRRVMCVLHGDHFMVTNIAHAPNRDDVAELREAVVVLERSLRDVTKRCDSLETRLVAVADLAARAEPVEPEGDRCVACDGEIGPVYGRLGGELACLGCWLDAQPKRCSDCREPTSEADVAERDGEALTCVACWERRAAFDAKRVLDDRDKKRRKGVKPALHATEEKPRAPKLTTKRLAQLVTLATLAGLGFSAAVAKVVCP